MQIDEELRHQIGLALNEATILGIEFNKEESSVACTFALVSMDENGNVPNDNRLLFIFKPFGRFVASLRNGNWDDINAPTEIFEPEEILEKIKSFNGQSIYGWDFVNCGDEDFGNLKERLSFDYTRGDSIGLTNTIDLFQEDGERHIDIRIWFDHFEIMTLAYEKIELFDFIENGKRGWDAVYDNNDKMADFGIIPATNKNEQKIESAISALTNPGQGKQQQSWWTRFKDRFAS